MKKLLMLLLFPLLMAACTKGGGSEDVITSEEPQTAEADNPNQGGSPSDLLPRGFIITAHMDLRLLDLQGNDRLNPASPGAVDLSKIKVYYVVDGKERLFYRSNLEAARGYLVYTPKETGERYYSLRLFFNIESKEEVTTTIVDWGDGHRDVFKVAFIRKENRISQRSIWLNDSLIFDLQKKIGGTQPMYEIKR
jgi:lipoprotein